MSGNAKDRSKYRALLSRLRKDLVIPPAQVTAPKKVPRFAIFSGPCFLGLLWAYRATTGVTDMDTARAILIVAWAMGVAGILTLAPVWGARLRHRFWIGTLFAVLLAFGLFEFDQWIVGKSVLVWPSSEFSLSETFGSVETTLYVNNQSASPVYSVWVKVSILTPGISSETLKVEIDDSVSLRPHPFRDELAIADAKWFTGFDDRHVEALYLLFPSVPPRVTYHVNVTGAAGIKGTGSARSLGFSLVPSGYISARGMSGFKMEVPEVAHFRSVGMKIVERKKRN